MLRRRLGYLTLVLMFGAGVIVSLLVRAGSPSNERSWIPEQARLAEVTIEGDRVRVDQLRFFRYQTSDRFTPGYETRTFDLNRLTRVWFVLTPFARHWRGPAHSFVSFGFGDSQFVAISVEARKETGESYGPVSGLLRRFELMYVIGDERDLIGQRLLHDYPLYLYPIKAPPERIRALFVAMVTRAEALRHQPEFYNTLTSNCTSNIVGQVNRIVPGAIPASWKTVFPGYIDEVGVRLGLIDTRLPVDAARERYRIDDAAGRFINHTDFSRLIRR